MIVIKMNVKMVLHALMTSTNMSVAVFLATLEIFVKMTSMNVMKDPVNMQRKEMNATTWSMIIAATVSKALQERIVQFVKIQSFAT